MRSHSSLENRKRAGSEFVFFEDRNFKLAVAASAKKPQEKKQVDEVGFEENAVRQQ